MTFGTRWEKLMGKCKKEEAEAIFRHYLDSGGTALCESRVAKLALLVVGWRGGKRFLAV